MKDTTLLPLSKFLLAVSALTQFVFALPSMFAPSFVNTVSFPPPFEPQSAFWLRYAAIAYIAMGLGAAYALWRNSWAAGRAYLVVGGSYNLMAIVLTALAAVTPPGVPSIAFLYIVLAIIYLVLVAFAWRQQSAREV
jgi:hypothetical protein